MSEYWNLKKAAKVFTTSVLFGALVSMVPHAGHAQQLHEADVQEKAAVTSNIRVDSLDHTEHVKGSTFKKDNAHTKESTHEDGSFKSRIDAILHPQPQPKVENALPAAPAPLAPVVARTVSANDDQILGTALASPEQCVRYLLSMNPNPSISVSPEKLVSYYYEEGAREGVRPDVAFVQALKETGFFRYGGTVTPDQNNYCGLGTTSAVVKGAYFSSSQLGVRAHIQHLLAYATTRQPLADIVDPRYTLVRDVYGTRTLNRWEDLNGRWAVPGNSYGQSILSMYRAMLRE